MFSLSSSFFLSPSLSLSLFLSCLKETMLLFWCMYYVYRISSFCCCHPMARPSFITVHLIVVSTSTTRHDICVLTQHWNQEKKKKERKKDWRNSRANTPGICKVATEQDQASRTEATHVRGQAKTISYFNGYSNQSFFLFFSLHWHIGEEHERTMMFRDDARKHASIGPYSSSQLFAHHFFFFFAYFYIHFSSSTDVPYTHPLLSVICEGVIWK
jgi:hypothetical protein